jgi:hypothetical protein
MSGVSFQRGSRLGGVLQQQRQGIGAQQGVLLVEAGSGVV